MSEDVKPRRSRFSPRISTFVLGMALILTLATEVYTYHLFRATQAQLSQMESSDEGRNAGMELGEFITKVKGELLKAEQARLKNEEAPLLKLKDCDLEVSFVLRSSAKAKAAGFLWGAYHFGVGADGVEQADYFLKTVQPGPQDLLVPGFEPNREEVSWQY